MNKRTFSPCPICNGDFIGVFKEVQSKYETGPDKVRVWAVCRNCGHRGIGAVGRFNTEEEKIEAAVRLWNQG